MIYLPTIKTKKPEIPEVMTPAEVRDVLRITQPTLRKLINTGKLPAIKVGHQTRILKPDLDKFIQENTTS